MAGVRIAILGAGNLGTTLGVVLAGAPGLRAGKSRDVALWSVEADVVREIRERRLNTKYLHDVTLPRAVLATSDLGEALAAADVVILTVPSGVVREVARQVAPFLGSPDGPGPGVGSGRAGGRLFAPAIVIGAAKGLESGSYLRMSQVIASELPEALRRRVLALSGPSIANELSQGVPTAVVLASPDLALARAARRAIQTPILRIQLSRDVAGVELGGVLKNAYTIALGLCDGLGLGLNTKAALLARALPELTRLGIALGGRRATFYGLAGLGDLIGTALSGHSRNRRMGEEVARRGSREKALESISGVVEGIGAVNLARELASRHRLRLPILEGVAGVLENGADPLKTITRLVG